MMSLQIKRKVWYIWNIERGKYVQYICVMFFFDVF